VQNSALASTDDIPGTVIDITVTAITLFQAVLLMTLATLPLLCLAPISWPLIKMTSHLTYQRYLLLLLEKMAGGIALALTRMQLL